MTAPRPVHATERAALMLQLVPYLVNKAEVSLEQAAADFDVTVDQMREMVEKLTLIGLPGDSGYWQLPGDLFDIDWDLLDEQGLIVITNTVGLQGAPRLTAREAAALLAGLQLARSLPGVASDEVIGPLLAKLARGASQTPAEVIVAPAPVDEVRVAVDEALRRGVAVSFTYKAPDAPQTTRTVDPVRVHITAGQWYLQGWCHLRRAMRTFHLDRVSMLTLTTEPITHAAEPVPELFQSGNDDLAVRVRFGEESRSRLGGYLDQAQIAVEGGVGVATIRVAGPQSLKRPVVGLGGAVEILGPDSARRAAADWAAAGLALYPEAPGAAGTQLHGVD